jgi:5-methylcytosine-specific restriction endonuclease McrA
MRNPNDFHQTLKPSEKGLYRNALLRKHKACRYCRQDLNKATATLDHYLPKIHYPHLKLKRDNLVLACRPCNMRKSDMLPDDFIAMLRSERLTMDYLRALPILRLRISWRVWLFGVFA